MCERVIVTKLTYECGQEEDIRMHAGTAEIQEDGEKRNKKSYY